MTTNATGIAHNIQLNWMRRMKGAMLYGPYLKFPFLALRNLFTLRKEGSWIQLIHIWITDIRAWLLHWIPSNNNLWKATCTFVAMQQCIWDFNRPLYNVFKWRGFVQYCNCFWLILKAWAKGHWLLSIGTKTHRFLVRPIQVECVPSIQRDYDLDISPLPPSIAEKGFPVQMVRHPCFELFYNKCM